MKLLKSWAAAAAMVALSGAVQAALVDRGGGLIYDTTLNLTWMADMNYAKTSGHTGPGVATSLGIMTWVAATTWADNLVYGGFDDWRLPTLAILDDTCIAIGMGGPIYNCTGGELSHLMVADLGNKPRESVLNQVGDSAEQVANLALFHNLQGNAYWSGIEFQTTDSGWAFVGYDGSQGASANPLAQFYAMAVRDGDVVSAVPEPQTLALVLLGLGLTVGTARRRQR